MRKERRPMAKRYTRINWQDKPSTATPISATNLNKMDKGIDDCDNAIEQLNDNLAGIILYENASGVASGSNIAMTSSIALYKRVDVYWGANTSTTTEVNRASDIVRFSVSPLESGGYYLGKVMIGTASALLKSMCITFSGASFTISNNKYAIAGQSPVDTETSKVFKIVGYTT
jgi:hypothetical protein